MYFPTKTLNLVLLLTGVVSAIPAFPLFDLPQTLSLPNSFASHALKKCHELNIDPLGPAPDDFESNTGYSIIFKAESQYSFWIAAQNAPEVVEHRRKQKRDDAPLSGVDIIFWDTHDCHPGSGQHYWDLAIGQQYRNTLINDVYYSLQITAGNINPNVWRLWLKKSLGNLSQYCKDVGNPNHYVYGGPGCARDLPLFDCVVLENA
ncbi:hypothetical protein BDD12DRAFT_892446 [Trichophaea hybrida]|nr:hypothetical protein BDD12DRAFT_892446 [Trichophaea hybrida]